MAGIFSLEAFGGLGGVSFASQLIMTVTGIIVALVASTVIYGVLKITCGIRLTQ